MPKTDSGSSSRLYSLPHLLTFVAPKSPSDPDSLGVPQLRTDGTAVLLQYYCMPHSLLHRERFDNRFYGFNGSLWGSIMAGMMGTRT